MSSLAVLNAPEGQEVTAGLLTKYKVAYETASGDASTARDTGNIRTTVSTFQRQTILYALAGFVALLWLASRK
jgi:hypothetical protein